MSKKPWPILRGKLLLIMGQNSTVLQYQCDSLGGRVGIGAEEGGSRPRNALQPGECGRLGEWSYYKMVAQNMLRKYEVK